MSIKINTLEIENVKRIKAVKLAFLGDDSLTIVGGDNGAGKTSLLDAICWAVGGEKQRPSSPKRDGSVVEPSVKIELSNGLIVERSGKRGTLKVTDSSGMRGGQALLNAFIPEFAYNLPKFLNASDRDKAKILLDIIGVGDELEKLDKTEKDLFNSRHALGQDKESKTKYADELAHYPDAPDNQLSIKDLIEEQQAILLRNAQNQEKRLNLNKLYEQQTVLEARIKVLIEDLKEAQTANTLLLQDIQLASMSVDLLRDQTTGALEESIYRIEATNDEVRANQEKEKALDAAHALEIAYDDLTRSIEDARARKLHLLETANLPYPELSVAEGSLIYKGKKWDCLASSEQLRIGTAIVRSLSKECGFVLIDKLEQFDLKTLAEFAEWLKQEDLQVIATRVSTGPECSIIIEDGTFLEDKNKKMSPNPATFTKGVF